MPDNPHFLYGTAWKEDQTKSLVELAIQQGFRAIDTANQRKHYHEAAVGQAIASAIQSELVQRDDLFLQTKYTFIHGQDHRLPYDPHAPIATQVEQSFASSLEHLGVTALDCYVLHGPSTRMGLTDDDWNAWRAMEQILDRGGTKLLGVSNVSLQQLQLLCQDARIQPAFVQNRCYAATGWDRAVRTFCQEHQIVYQGFSLLTANTAALSRPEVAAIAKRHGRTVARIAFRFAIEVGMLPLTGTTNPDHMRSDLNILDFRLEQKEIDQIERIAER